MARKILLLSNSRNEGQGFLGHVPAELDELFSFSSTGSVLILPYAVPPGSSIINIACQYFLEQGLRPLVADDAPAAAGQLSVAEAIFVMGGNTFRLLSHLYTNDLIDVIVRRVSEGIPYLGASAGSNVACPTIGTTNDMPIVETPSLKALGIVPFQINTHYLKNEDITDFTGETRLERLQEFARETRRSVIALPEGTAISAYGEKYILVGPRNAQLVDAAGGGPLEVPPGDISAAVLASLTG